MNGLPWVAAGVTLTGSGSRVHTATAGSNPNANKIAIRYAS